LGNLYRSGWVGNACIIAQVELVWVTPFIAQVWLGMGISQPLDSRVSQP
jgi:hypothetical protein